MHACTPTEHTVKGSPPLCLQLRCCMIYKRGDDLRQDQFVLQVCQGACESQPGGGTTLKGLDLCYPLKM